MKNPNFRKSFVSTVNSIESGGRRGVTIPFTDLSIRDRFEIGKHLLTEKGS